MPLFIGLALGIYLAQTKEAMMIAICIVTASIFVMRGKIGNAVFEEGCEKRYERKRLAAAALAFAVFGAALSMFAELRLDRDLQSLLSEGAGSISGVITDVSINSGYTGFTLKTGSGARVQVLLYDKGDKPAATAFEALRCEGCRAVFDGRAEAPKGARNPHCFDYRRHLASRGICAYATAKSFEAGEISSPVLHTAALWKLKFIEKLANFADEGSVSLVVGMLFGDKGMIDDEVYETFQKNGTAHVLAVSGLHIGIVYAFACRLTRGRRTRKARVFTALFVIVYIVVAGFAPGTTRAGAMILLHILSKELHMRYDMLSAAAAVGIANMVINPLAIWNTGFQMSYLAIFTICFVTQRIGRGKYALLTGSFAIQLGLTPYTAFVFNYFSIVSVFVNIPVVYLASLMVPIAIVMLYLSLFAGLVGGFAGGALEGVFERVFEGVFEFLSFTIVKLCKGLCALNEMAFLDGNSSFSCVSPPVWGVVLYYGLMFYACSEAGYIDFARRRGGKALATLAAVAVLALGCNAIYTGPFDKAGMIFVDVGQGDCMHIRTENGQNVLIDSGGSYYTSVGEKTLKPYLLKNGCGKLDMVVLTHLHTDHCAAINEICDDVKIGKLCVFEGYSLEDVRNELPEYEGEVAFLKKGDILRLSEGVNIEILAPERLRDSEKGRLGNTSDENAISLIARVSYNGVSAMMTADIDSAGEMRLARSVSPDKLNCDIVKVAHHGSKYSSCEEFLKAVSPEAAVIQVGKNNYGHPAEETLERLQNEGAAVYRTDLTGAVGVLITKTSYKILIWGQAPN